MSPLELTLLTAIPTAAIIVAAVFLWTAARRRQSQVTSHLQPVERAPVDRTIEDTAIQSLSSRLAVIEGRIGSIAATLEGVHVLQQRVAGIETAMPAVQEAYEKYADQISRADKRDTERLRRTEKMQGQTAGEAAAALSGVAEAGGPLPTQSATPQNEKIPGVLGGGRTRRT